MQGRNLLHNKVFLYPILASLIAIYIIWNVWCASYAVNKLNMNDFGKFYYSTILFLQKQDMYGPTPATLIPIGASESKQFWNMNPPHFHLLILPFVSLPPAMAFSAWMITGFICLCVSMFLILKEIHFKVDPLKFSLILLALLAFSGTSITLITGQISFFVFLCVTYAWLRARRGKWLHAALFIGICISIKIFFLILVPYLVVRRQMFAAFLALLVTITIFITGVFIFGLNSYISWINAISHMDWAWAAMNASVLGFLTRILSPSPHFFPLTEAKGLIFYAWVVIVAVIGLITISVAAIDHSPHCIDRGFALILTAALLISPLGWVYYSWIVIGPLICLIQYWYMEKWNVTRSPINRIRNSLLFIAYFGFFLPLPAVLLFQPSPVATLTFGSIYFWAFVAFWMALVSDYFIQALCGNEWVDLPRSAPSASDE